jgi:hypothetical protein
LPLVFHDKSAAVYKALPHSPEGNQEKKAKKQKRNIPPPNRPKALQLFDGKRFDSRKIHVFGGTNLAEFDPWIDESDANIGEEVTQQHEERGKD